MRFVLEKLGFVIVFRQYNFNFLILSNLERNGLSALKSLTARDFVLVSKFPTFPHTDPNLYRHHPYHLHNHPGGFFGRVSAPYQLPFRPLPAAETRRRSLRHEVVFGGGGVFADQRRRLAIAGVVARRRRIAFCRKLRRRPAAKRTTQGLQGRGDGANGRLRGFVVAMA